jgi:CheY-like chemotaxis protein
MLPLLEAALQRVRDGETTLEEVSRVVGDDGSGPADAASEAVATERPPERPAPAPPPERRPAGPSIQAAPPPALEEDEEGPARILVVDDDGATRNIARSLLEKEGFAVAEAADGSEALVYLARGESFDLMVLDLDMPILGGREVLRAVRGAVSTAGLPVVVLTGIQDPGAEVELMEQGADDYIRKPIDPPRFLTRVRAALRRGRG